MGKYLVRFEIDVAASTPTLAAIAARDMLLDPNHVMMADVHAYEFNKEADDWFANEDEGWCADFRYGGVRPEQVFAFRTVRFDRDGAGR